MSSCVPATPLDMGGAVLEAADLAPFTRCKEVIGLGEMMNVPGVLRVIRSVLEKLALFTVRDGHAPLLSGKDLNTYILAGLQSDHECTTRAEACEKLKKGMYIFYPGGSTEHNIEELIPIVTPVTVSRYCFATDDCHAVPPCGRRAYRPLYPEGGWMRDCAGTGDPDGNPVRCRAFRPCRSRGTRPGEAGGFLCHRQSVQVRRAAGLPSGIPLVLGEFREPAALPVSFQCRMPSAEEIAIKESGSARVIGLVPHQIITESLIRKVSGVEYPGPVTGYPESCGL